MIFFLWGWVTNGWVPRHPTEAYFAAVRKWKEQQQQ